MTIPLRAGCAQIVRSPDPAHRRLLERGGTAEIDLTFLPGGAHRVGRHRAARYASQPPLIAGV